MTETTHTNNLCQPPPPNTHTHTTHTHTHANEEKAYTTTTERKSFRERFWKVLHWSRLVYVFFFSLRTRTHAPTHGIACVMVLCVTCLGTNSFPCIYCAIDYADPHYATSGIDEILFFVRAMFFGSTVNRKTSSFPQLRATLYFCKHQVILSLPMFAMSRMSWLCKL